MEQKPIDNKPAVPQEKDASQARDPQADTQEKAQQGKQDAPAQQSKT